MMLKHHFAVERVNQRRRVSRAAKADQALGSSG